MPLFFFIYLLCVCNSDSWWVPRACDGPLVKNDNPAVYVVYLDRLWSVHASCNFVHSWCGGEGRERGDGIFAKLSVTTNWLTLMTNWQLQAA
ncbi:hypothetical protein BC939DRAFT_433953 [Gamsiella multidivaricata]|uniref:uncharacterized protein n=1 Tax=Gamsiella multidivaricata TaxID=101098 RepID=UPI00221E6498|nr:uncharacterized protein BC939DRAFT_433953 [Gamsiella multidivaricata]KAI7832639.1 hypothetical protein BC939DRAFT_433953 [Gamsiella multidivaricata]